MRMNSTHKNGIQQRRERLRDLITTEDECYQQELLNNYKTKAEELSKSRELRLLGLRAERERQRQKFVEEMRVQQLINSCDEIRPYLRRKLQDECKNCQQLQIADNSLKKMEERDRNRLWHEIQNQVFNQMTQREVEESLVAYNRNLNDQQILRKQMLEKNEIPKRVDFEADTMHCGKIFGDEPSDRDLFIQHKKKQLQFAQDLLSQQALKDERKKTQRNNEILHELAAIDLCKKEIEVEKQNACLEKEQNMKETRRFLKYRKTVDDEKTKLERENDHSTESLQNAKTDEYLKNRNYFIQQRNEFNKGIHEERWQQIVDRRQKMLQAKNEKINDIIEANEIYAHIAHTESELERKKKNFRLQYGRELRAQCNYKRLEDDKSTASSNNLTKAIQEEEAHKSEIIKTNFGRIHQIYPVHPNYKVCNP